MTLSLLFVVSFFTNLPRVKYPRSRYPLNSGILMTTKNMEAPKKDNKKGCLL